MAKSRRTKKHEKTSRTSVVILSVVIVLVFWLILSVAFELPFLDFVKDGPTNTTGGLPTANNTATPTATPTAAPSGEGVTPTPDVGEIATATPTPGATTEEEKSVTCYLFAYRDGSVAYSENYDYSYTGTLDKQALARDCLNRLPSLLNYNIRYNTIILDENGIHIDLASDGAPFIKDSYYFATGVHPVDYGTYDQQVYGILDSICYTAKDCLGSNTGVYITMDGKAMSFTGLTMNTQFSAESPYLGYTYYHEHYETDSDIYAEAMNNGVALTFAANVKYYFRGTIGTNTVDVTLTSTPSAGMVIIKIMSKEDTPMYIFNIDSNKVLVSDPEDTTLKVVLYQKADSSLVGEWHTITGGNTIVDKVQLTYMDYEVYQ